MFSFSAGYSFAAENERRAKARRARRARQAERRRRMAETQASADKAGQTVLACLTCGAAYSDHADRRHSFKPVDLTPRSR